MEKSIRRQFEHLAIMRSPENLTGDGEYGRRETQRRHKLIMAEWKDLEKLLGRKVSLREIEDGLCSPREPDYPPGYMQQRGAA